MNNPDFLPQAIPTLYKVHRYTYISEKHAKEENEDVSDLVADISEWYSLIIGLFLKSKGKLVQLYNSFLSKKDRKENEVQKVGEVVLLDGVRVSGD